LNQVPRTLARLLATVGRLNVVAMARRLLTALAPSILSAVTWLVVTLSWAIVLLLAFGVLMFLMGEIDGELGAA
jgi:hypothetical protein